MFLTLRWSIIFLFFKLYITQFLSLNQQNNNKWKKQSNNKMNFNQRNRNGKIYSNMWYSCLLPIEKTVILLYAYTQRLCLMMNHNVHVIKHFNKFPSISRCLLYFFVVFIGGGWFSFFVFIFCAELRFCYVTVSIVTILNDNQ